MRFFDSLQCASYLKIYSMNLPDVRNKIHCRTIELLLFRGKEIDKQKRFVINAHSSPYNVNNETDE